MTDSNWSIQNQRIMISIRFYILEVMSHKIYESRFLILTARNNNNSDMRSYSLSYTTYKTKNKGSNLNTSFLVNRHWIKMRKKALWIIERKKEEGKSKAPDLIEAWDSRTELRDLLGFQRNQRSGGKHTYYSHHAQRTLMQRLPRNWMKIYKTT